tara:strand:- start:2357 stop:2686 length:330 start_codon:yes stop_codon:yes gene_type:complete
MINATKKWVFLKVSSIILIPLLLWFMISLISIYDKSFEEVLIFFTTQPSKLLVSLLMIVAFFYSALSISEIFEDYIHDQKTKYVASVLLYLFAITIPLLTIVIILTLSI